MHESAECVFDKNCNKVYTAQNYCIGLHEMVRDNIVFASGRDMTFFFDSLNKSYSNLIHYEIRVSVPVAGLHFCNASRYNFNSWDVCVRVVFPLLFVIFLLFVFNLDIV